MLVMYNRRTHWSKAVYSMSSLLVSPLVVVVVVVVEVVVVVVVVVVAVGVGSAGVAMIVSA
jgi:hypothetical protein